MKVLLRSFFFFFSPLRTDMVNCGCCIVKRVLRDGCKLLELGMDVMA